jgi:hypothetical protein
VESAGLVQELLEREEALTGAFRVSKALAAGPLRARNSPDVHETNRHPITPNHGIALVYFELETR